MVDMLIPAKKNNEWMDSSKVRSELLWAIKKTGCMIITCFSSPPRGECQNPVLISWTTYIGLMHLTWCTSSKNSAIKLYLQDYVVCFWNMSIFQSLECEMSPLRARVKWYYGKITLLSNTLSGCDLPTPWIKNKSFRFNKKSQKTTNMSPNKGLLQ